MIYSVLIMPWYNKVTSLEEGELRTRIEALAAKVKFPLTEISVSDGSKQLPYPSKAYVSGVLRSNRIVVFNTLIEQATNDEIIAIVGRELGNWKSWQSMQTLFLTQLNMLVGLYLFGLGMSDSQLFASFGFESTKKPVFIGFTLVSQALAGPVYLSSFLMTLSIRKNEFQADAFAVDLGYANDLQMGLTKLAIEKLAIEKDSWKGNQDAFNPDPLYSAYNCSSPSLLERLEAITKRAKKAD